VLTQDCLELLYGDGLGVLNQSGRYVLVPRPLEGRR
jgi:hypothetical protein